MIKEIILNSVLNAEKFLDQLIDSYRPKANSA